MKNYFYLLFITILFSSCSDSPVSPTASDNSSEGKSNLFRNYDFISNPNIAINEKQIAQIKFDENLLNSSNVDNKIFTINYKPEVSGEFNFNLPNDKIIIEILDSDKKIISVSSNGNINSDNISTISLTNSEIYSINIFKTNSGLNNLKLNDIIYISTVKQEGSNIASLNISVNTCDSCLVVNSTFSQSFNNQQFTNSEFYNCAFEYIQMNENVFTNTLFSNCGFSGADVNVNNFENSTFSATNFINNSGFLQCNFNNTSFTSGSFTAVEFSQSSFLRSKMKLLTLFSCIFNNCDMQYASISSPLYNVNMNYISLINANLSSGTINNYNLQYSFLNGSNFTNANITNCNLNEVNISGATFMASNLSNSNLCGVRGTPAVFKNVNQTATKCPYKQ